MSWVNRDGDQSRNHTLAEPLNEHRALCGVAVTDVFPSPTREDCPTCRPPRPRNPDFPKRLPRHTCPDPDCNATHIIGRNV